MAVPETTADTITVRDAKTHLADKLYLVNADIDLSLSHTALEALENGIALTVVINFEIRRVREFIWNELVAELEAKRRLSFHPLSNQYLVEDLNAGATSTFRSLREALKALGQVRDFPLIDAYLLEKDVRYVLQVGAYLDIESLPTPLRVLAYLNPDWHLSSEWYEYPLNR
ncbi:MAG: DUF4390 domain-containing protein [Gammaproteobacteria bacterium]